MNSPAITVGILAAALPRADLARRFGDYSRMFNQLMERANGSAGGLELRTYEVLNGVFPASVDECDGYIITGSQASVFDDVPWIHELCDFTIALNEKRHKLVGICFGHQMIAHVLDGAAERSDRGWGLGVQEYRIVRRLPCMEPHVAWLRLHSSHQDQVAAAPSQAIVFAESEFCPIAGMAIGEHFLSIQGHPEFTAPYAEGLMMTRREELDESFDRGMATVRDPTDATLFAQWMLRFLGAGSI